MVVDTKGGFAGLNNNSAITFPIKQKLLWHKKEIYAQKIIPRDWFAKTWIPKKCLITKLGKVSKSAWKLKCKTIEEVMSEL